MSYHLSFITIMLLSLLMLLLLSLSVWLIMLSLLWLLLMLVVLLLLLIVRKGIEASKYMSPLTQTNNLTQSIQVNRHPIITTQCPPHLHLLVPNIPPIKPMELTLLPPECLVSLYYYALFLILRYYLVKLHLTSHKLDVQSCPYSSPQVQHEQLDP